MKIFQIPKKCIKLNLVTLHLDTYTNQNLEIVG